MQIEFIDQTNDENSSMQTLSRDGLYGDGFFTTGIINNGKIQHWDYHLERVLFSASRLYFSDFSLELFRTSIEKLVFNIESAAFRISITRCQNLRGYAISDSALSMCRLHLFSLPPQISQHCELVFAHTPISVNPYFAGIKHLNRLDSVIAANEIQNKNQEALMFNGDSVISGSRSNLFVYLRSEWYTPLLDRAGVNGITRLRILKTMEENGITCHKSPIHRSDLKDIDAAFVCNSLMGIWSSNNINGKSLATEPSVVIQKLLDGEGS